MSLNNKEDELQKIVQEYVTTQDLEDYAVLQEKIDLANKKVEEFVKRKAAEEHTEIAQTEPDEDEENKKLPHYIDINVQVVVKKSDKSRQEPYTIEDMRKNYQIDYITDDHKIMTENIFDVIQTLLSEKCKLHIKTPEVPEQ